MIGGAGTKVEFPPLFEGEDPFQVQEDSDRLNQKRVEWAHRLWHDQDTLLRQRDRTVEEHLRMLAGKHWSIWNETLGRWVDAERFLSDEERRWRFLPVVNRCLHWFMLLHARFTENPPIIGFQPATGDRLDAELAEVADTIWKAIWNEAGMLERVDEIMAWMIPGGVSYAKSRIDPLAGEIIQFEGPGIVPVVDPDGEPVPGLERMVDRVPFDQDGNPLGHFDELAGEFVAQGEPHVEYEGAIKVDVLSPFEARGEWGPAPWHEKAWHAHRSLLTPEQVFEMWGIEVDPTMRGMDAAGSEEYQRLLLGSGFYGASQGNPLLESSTHGTHEYVEVLEVWHRPSRRPGMQRTPQSPGGRLTIVAGDQVIRDGVRPGAFLYTSPIRCFEAVNVPGRPSGTSPQEMVVGPNKTENRLTAQILQHATISANPDRIIDLGAGIDPGQVTNRPGNLIEAYLEGYDGDPIRFTNPPPLGDDVWRSREMLRQDFNDLGNVAGAEGRPPTSDASGELVKELRFNSDRFVGPTARRAVLEFGRMAEDWTVLIPMIWDEEKILRVAGDDSIATVVHVQPQLFEQGKINVVPDLESMLPEGRGERQARVERHYQMGLYGEPGSPAAVNRFFELSRFPHMQREARPGGMTRVTAEQMVGRLWQGVPAREIPVFEWYDHGVYLEVVERAMQRPEFLTLDPEIMQQFVVFRQTLLLAAAMTAQKGAALQAAVQGASIEAAVDATPPSVARALNSPSNAGSAAAPGEGSPAASAPA